MGNIALHRGQGLYRIKRVCFQDPPVRGTGRRASTRDIHDRVAHSKKNSRWQRLREEVGQVVRAGDKKDGHVVGLHPFAHEGVTAVDMFGTLMVLKIVREIDRGFVIHREGSGICRWESKIGKE
eukprot:3495255-Pleurochrysis_carterae.AAC.1